MTLQIVRAKGGHLIHRKQPGVNAALCGFEPRTRRTHKQGRAMRERAGWWIYAKEPTFGAGFNMNCSSCMQIVRTSG